jgi:hypothetical protein
MPDEREQQTVSLTVAVAQRVEFRVEGRQPVYISGIETPAEYPADSSDSDLSDSEDEEEEEYDEFFPPYLQRRR